MDKLIYVELVKYIWIGIVVMASTYMICDTIRINKARELKAMIKIEEKER